MKEKLLITLKKVLAVSLALSMVSSNFPTYALAEIADDSSEEGAELILEEVQDDDELVLDAEDPEVLEDDLSSDESDDSVEGDVDDAIITDEDGVISLEDVLVEDDSEEDVVLDDTSATDDLIVEDLADEEEPIDVAEEELPVVAETEVEAEAQPDLDEALVVPEEEEPELTAQVSGYDSPATALAISTGYYYSDNLTNYDDVDWFKFTLPSAGYINIWFRKDYSDEGEGWEITLYDSTASQEINYWWYDANNMKEEVSEGIGLAAGTYYIKASKKPYSSTTTTRFELAVVFTESSLWEREPTNNAPNHAMTISAGKVYHGTTHNYDDKDWYKFTLSKTRYVNLTFAHDYDGGSGGWQAILYDYSASDSLDTLYSYANDMKSVSTGKLKLSPGTYYVKVCRNWSQTNVNYRLKISVSTKTSVAKATVSSIGTRKWTGKAIKPKPVVKVKGKTLKLGTDYTLSYKNNVKPKSTAKVIIKGKGKYTGTKTVTFKIGPKRGAWRKSGSRWWWRWANGTYPKSQFLTVKGKRYYFDNAGWMVTGWRKISGNWYYFNSSGAMVTCRWVGDYYLQANGVMAKNRWVDGWHVGADGKWDATMGADGRAYARR